MLTLQSAMRKLTLGSMDKIDHHHGPYQSLPNFGMNQSIKLTPANSEGGTLSRWRCDQEGGLEEGSRWEEKLAAGTRQSARRDNEGDGMDSNLLEAARIKGRGVGDLGDSEKLGGLELAACLNEGR